MPLVGRGGGGGSFDDQEAWSLNGNYNVNPNTQFLGTKDNNPLIVKTNNQEVARLTPDGRLGIGTNNPESHVHIKSHEGFDGSGLQITTFAMSSDDLNHNIIYSYKVPPNSVSLITLKILGRQGTSERCAFQRTIAVFRDGGIAQVLRKWQSDFTMKSNNNFDISYNITMDTIHFKVRNANPIETHWGGHIQIDNIS